MKGNKDKKTTAAIVPAVAAAEQADATASQSDVTSTADDPAAQPAEEAVVHQAGSREAREAREAAPVVRKGVPGFNRLPTFKDYTRLDLAQQDAKAKKGAK
jgi:hypothetical protein